MGPQGAPTCQWRLLRSDSEIRTDSESASFAEDATLKLIVGHYLSIDLWTFKNMLYGFKNIDPLSAFETPGAWPETFYNRRLLRDSLLLCQQWPEKGFPASGFWLPWVLPFPPPAYAGNRLLCGRPVGYCPCLGIGACSLWGPSEVTGSL